ncbi:MAG: hypothetical protein WC552_02115 [Candidatus Omnitrophota bacterium]
MPVITVFMILVFLVGCGTARVKKDSGQSVASPARADSISALQSVAEAVSGQEIDAKGMRDLSRQIQQDKDAQAAVESITSVLSGQKIGGKFCPVCGQRYGSRVKNCPVDGAVLETLP